MVTQHNASAYFVRLYWLNKRTPETNIHYVYEPVMGMGVKNYVYGKSVHRIYNYGFIERIIKNE